MRCLLLLLLFTGTSLAAPTIRWVGRFGDPRTDKVVETLSESGTEIRVRLEEGVRTIPVQRLIEFAREGNAQQDLLDARRDAAAGLRLEKARVVLERYVREGKPAWTREYAAAYLVVVADRSNAKDLVARTDAFLKRHPKSRFVGLMHFLRARHEAPRLEDTMKMKEAFQDGYERIEAAKGPVRLGFRLLMIAAHESRERDPEDMAIYSRVLNTMGRVAAANGNDLLYVSLAEAAYARASLEAFVRIGASIVAMKKKPLGPRADVALLTRATEILDAHTELRFELYRELGRLEAACGNAEAARAAWAKAREYARKLPDPRPLRAIEADLKRAAE